MAVTEPSGDFDYLWEDLGDLDEDYDFRVPSPPPAPPWYRTPAALVAMGAIGIAVVAILVSAVLLMSRNSRGPSVDVETTIATTRQPPPTTAPPMTATVPPGPTEAPPPSEPTASVPVAVEPPRQQQPEPTKPPEIGVTRTPVTRSPISVRPNPRPAFPHN